MELINTVFILCILFAIICQVIFWRYRKINRKNIVVFWKKFIAASESNNMEEVRYYGDKLIWNRYISQDQIDFINQLIRSNIVDYPELGKLYEVSKGRHTYLSTQEKQFLLDDFEKFEKQDNY